MSKRTVIKADEELVIKGKLTVEGNVTQIETTEIVNRLESNSLIINSDGENVTAELTLNSDGTLATMSFNEGDGAIKFNQPVDLGSYDIVTTGNISGSYIFGDGSGLTGLTTSIVSEGTNLYFTQARVRGNVSVVDAGGDGSLTYNTSSGVFTYTGPSSAEVRAHFSATTATGITYDSANGVFALASIPNSSLTNSSITVNGYSTALGGTVTLDTSDIAEDGNLYFTNARVRAAISHVDAGGDGSFAYNSSTGVFTYTGPSQAEANARMDAYLVGGDGIDYTSGTIAVDSTVVRTSGNQTIAGNKTFTGTTYVTGNIEPTTSNTYSLGSWSNHFDYVFARVLHAEQLDLGDANISDIHNSFYVGSASSPIITRSGYGLTFTHNASGAYYEVNAGDGLQISGNNVAVNNTVVRTTGDQTITGNIGINGTLTVAGTINSQNVEDTYVKDTKITLNSNAAVDNTVSIEVNRPYAGANTYIKWDESTDQWKFTNNGSTEFLLPTSTTDLAEGANLYYTPARANSAMNAYLVGGDGINYANGTIDVDNTVIRTTGNQQFGNLKIGNTSLSGGILIGDPRLDGHFVAGGALANTAIAVGGTGGNYKPEIVIVHSGSASTTSQPVGALRFIKGNTTDPALTGSQGPGGDYGDIVWSWADNNPGSGGWDSPTAKLGVYHSGTDSQFYIKMDRINYGLQTVLQIDSFYGDVTFGNGVGGSPRIKMPGNPTAPSNKVLRANATNGIEFVSNVAYTDQTQTISGNTTFSSGLVIPSPGTPLSNNGSIYHNNVDVFAVLNGTAVKLTPQSDVGEIEDVGSNGIDIYAGYRLVAVGNANIKYHGIKSITNGSYIDISEASNVITVAGNATGIRGLISASGNISYNSTTGVISENLTTTDIDEGNNLYFTAARSRGNISGTGLITYNSNTGVISTTADNYSNWNIRTDSGAGATHSVSSNSTVIVSGGTGITVTNTGGNITIASTNSADIEAVTAGSGLTGGGTSGAVTLNVGAGDGITVNADNVALSTSGVASGTYGNASAVSQLVIDSFGRTTSATNVAISVTASQVSDFNSAANTVINSYLVGGDGVNYSNGTIDVDNSVVRTTGNQTIAGDKTFTGNTNIGSYNTDNNFTGRFKFNRSGVGSGDATAPNGDVIWLSDGYNDSDACEIVFFKSRPTSSPNSGDAIGGINFKDGYQGNNCLSLISYYESSGKASLKILNNNLSNTVIEFTSDSKVKIANSYILPNTDGTNGQKLTTYGNGIVYWSTESADITEVVAGSGLTGGGSSGSVTLNIGAGAGITVNADNVALTSGVITTGANTYGTASQVPAITVDTYGRVTSASNTTISITASQVSDFTSSVNTAIDSRIIGGSGLTYSGGTLAVGAGNYIQVGADDISVDATSTNTANKVVVRDSSGNFAANIITATATSARYADLAENYLADADYLPGTVLVFGGDTEVTAATTPTSTRIAGVVTTQPAHVMNSHLDGPHVACIALRGRVPVKVMGVVRKGDVLVSAGEGHIGYAVAALYPRDVPAAAMVGKAIGDKLDAGPGVVEALI